jgi:hypothetical protein
VIRKPQNGRLRLNQKCSDARERKVKIDNMEMKMELIRGS